MASPNNALTQRHGGSRQGVCVPWIAGRICFGVRAGQSHLFTGSGAPPGGRALMVRFSGVVSANPFSEIACKRPPVLGGFARAGLRSISVQ